jgi:hypothetical protein
LTRMTSQWVLSPRLMEQGASGKPLRGVFDP